MYIASLAGVERPHKESVGLGSYMYMEQKAVVLSKYKSEYSYQLMVGHLIKKKRRIIVLASFCMSL